MKTGKVLAAILLPMALLACEQDSGQKETLGTLLGAAGGAILGSQVGKGSGRIAATAVGTLLGAWTGREIGKSLDNADRAAMQRTTHKALESTPSSETIEWRNPDSGHRGTVTPEPAYKDESGRYCREYQQTVTIGMRTERAYGTACRQPDGSWQIVNN